VRRSIRYRPVSTGMYDKERKMNKVKEYIRLSTDELVNKVSWPTWEDLQESTVIVMVASLLIAMVIYVIDIVSSSALGFYYQIFQG
jgi:preprotein translocase subunit SecE